MLMAATNLYGVPVHMAAKRLYEECHKGESDAIDPLRWACTMFLWGSWMFFAACWLVFLDSSAGFWNTIPSDIRIIIVILPLGFSAFGIVATCFYLWLLASCDRGVYPDVEKMRTTMWALNTSFDVLSVTVKVTVAAIVVFSDQFGPGSGK
jgi:hypothetical protein